MIFASKLIPIVANKVKLRAETFGADHFARPLPVRDAVADLEREREVVREKMLSRQTWQGLGRAEVAITRPNTEAATLFSGVTPCLVLTSLVLTRLSWEKTEPPDSVASVDMKS